MNRQLRASSSARWTALPVNCTRRYSAVPKIASDDEVGATLQAAANELNETRFSARFLLTEWRRVVDAWQLRSWEAYRDVSRLGRKTRIGGSQTEAVWGGFARAPAKLDPRAFKTSGEVVGQGAAYYSLPAGKPVRPA